MENMYESDFGFIDLSEIPKEYQPVFPVMEEIIESVYTVGGDVGTGPAVLVRHPDHNDAGQVIGEVIYVEIPFRGSFLHEVAREKNK